MAGMNVGSFMKMTELFYDTYGSLKRYNTVSYADHAGCLLLLRCLTPHFLDGAVGAEPKSEQKSMVTRFQYKCLEVFGSVEPG